MSKEFIQSLHRRLNKIEESLYNEAKQVGLLYHVCTLDAYLKYIKPDDTLSASGNYINFLYKGVHFVSFTRDQFFAVETQATRNSDVLVQLVIDGNKLSEKYKIAPYNDFAYDLTGDLVNFDKGHEYNREKEEVAPGPIKNISKYITEYRVDFRDLTDATFKDLESSGLIEKDAIYFPFAKNVYRSNDIIHDFIKQKNISLGEPLEFIMDDLKEYSSMQNTLVDDAFSHDVDKASHAIGDLLIGFDVNKKYPKYGYLLPYYMANYKDGDHLIITEALARGADLFPESGVDCTELLFQPPLSQQDHDAALILRAMFHFSRLDPNHFIRDNNKDSLLTKAISLSMKETFDTILNPGRRRLDVNMKNASGSTALFSAAANKDPYFLKNLLKIGADPFVEDSLGASVLEYVATEKNEKLLQAAMNKIIKNGKKK